MSKKNFKFTYATLMVFGILLLLNPGSPVMATEKPKGPGKGELAGKVTEDAGMVGDEWEYTFEDRPDPFLPFIEPQVATKNIPEEEDVILTGMQLFEPGQLKLVAIMFSTKSKIAMVEDVTGKGYVINEGMLIGRFGVVSQINPDQVNITETRQVAGKEVVSPVVMRLNKDGDK